MVRAGYKQTEIGVMPEDWQALLIGELGAFTKGQGIRKDEAQSGDIPCIRYGEIYTHHNDIVRNFSSWISPDVAKTSKRLKRGDLLFSGSGETKEEIGKCVAFINEIEAYAGGDIVILTPNKGCSRFLGYLLNAPSVARRKASLGQGDAVVHIGASALALIPIPFPPSDEQHGIAEALSDADAWIESLEKLIAKKRLIKQGAMQELLTGKKRLPGFEKEWAKDRLGKFLHLQVGFPFSSAYFNTDGIGERLIKNRDLKNDDQQFFYTGPIDNSFVVKSGDLLVGMDGDFILCPWRKGNALLNQRVGRIIAHSPINLCFVYYHLAKPLKEIEAGTASTTVKHLSHGDIENIELDLPAFDEQAAIAKVLLAMDSEISALEQQLAKARAIKQGMMQELLTGRIRLV